MDLDVASFAFASFVSPLHRSRTRPARGGNDLDDDAGGHLPVVVLPIIDDDDVVVVSVVILAPPSSRRGTAADVVDDVATPATEAASGRIVVASFPSKLVLVIDVAPLVGVMTVVDPPPSSFGIVACGGRGAYDASA